VGVVSIHSANNAFKDWPEYASLHGLVWRDQSGHGSFHEFEVNLIARDHPIVKGLPQAFATRDELYHKLNVPLNASFTQLANAQSSAESGGTGGVETTALTVQFGKGRVFATPLGHVWTGKDETKASITGPGFKTLLVRGAEWAATGSVTLGDASLSTPDARTHNTLSDAERAEGWTLLFDGTRTDAWRSFNKPNFPADGWKVEGGVLKRQKGQAGGDLITREQYADFEFAVDWLATPGANSGIIYRVAEGRQFPWLTGMEMQILDDARHNDGKKPKTRAGTLYDIFPTSVDVARPAGEWNHARVIARGTRIQHILNGFVVVDTDLAGEEYKAAHAASKWPTMPEYATQAQGHIALQEHGDEVWFRNIKVRKLDPAPAQALDAPKPAPGASALPAKAHSAIAPSPRDAGWTDHVAALNERIDAALKAASADPAARPRVLFVGDSITQGWLHDGRNLWEKHYAPLHAINLGISGDRTQHVLWRLQNQHAPGLRELASKDLAPTAIVLMIGTNNSNGSDNTAEEIADGIVAIVKELRSILPEARILFLDIFPRGARPNPQRDKNTKATELAAATLGSDPSTKQFVTRLNLGPTFTGPDGTLSPAIMPDALHLSEAGYQAWAEAMEPTLRQLLDAPK
jgi:lysophospholipase L1-like esterase/type 1 glutamine amidotransferase